MDEKTTQSKQNKRNSIGCELINVYYQQYVRKEKVIV